MAHVLTVDLEDWFHVCGAEATLPPSRWDDLPSRLPEATRGLLDILDRHDARATFFVVGYVARRFPDLVAEIESRGHSIGCHGYLHRRIYDLTPEEFSEDLRRAVCAIEEAGVSAPVTFRAPEWSIRPFCAPWALEILAQQGFRYDASMVPLTWMGSRRFPHRATRMETPAGPVWEIPITTVRGFQERLPVTGGLGMRTTPEWYTHHVMEWDERKGHPCVVSMHATDLANDLPSLPCSATRRFMQRFLRNAFPARLMRLLRRFRFRPIEEVFADPETPDRGDFDAGGTTSADRVALWRSWALSAPVFVVWPSIAAALGATVGLATFLAPIGFFAACYHYHWRHTRDLVEHQRRKLEDAMGGDVAERDPLLDSVPGEATDLPTHP